MKTRSTTILTVRHQGTVALGGDGQVTIGSSIIKADAVKIRRLMDGKVITGFAGSTADAFALLERFEAKLKDFPANVPRTATELAKEWRTDRVLRRLEAMLAVVDARHTLLVTGLGDVVQPTDGILGDRLRRELRRGGGPSAGELFEFGCGGDRPQVAGDRRRDRRVY